MRVRCNGKRRIQSVAWQALAIKLRREFDTLQVETNGVVAYLHQVAEDDKRRLALILHDELGAALTVAKVELHRLNEQTLARVAPAQQHLARLSEMLDEVVLIERNAIESLRPALIDHLGLSVALEDCVSNACQRAKLDCICRPLTGADAVPREQALVIYRLVEEGLANIIDGARSQSVEISLVRDEKGFHLRITADAEGHAIEPPTVHQRRLASMRHRAQALGGTLDVQSAPGRGTHVNVFFPAKP